MCQSRTTAVNCKSHWIPLWSLLQQTGPSRTGRGEASYPTLRMFIVGSPQTTVHRCKCLSAKWYSSQHICYTLACSHSYDVRPEFSQSIDENVSQQVGYSSHHVGYGPGTCSNSCDVKPEFSQSVGYSSQHIGYGLGTCSHSCDVKPEFFQSIFAHTDDFVFWTGSQQNGYSPGICSHSRDVKPEFSQLIFAHTNVPQRSGYSSQQTGCSSQSTLAFSLPYVFGTVATHTDIRYSSTPLCEIVWRLLLWWTALVPTYSYVNIALVRVLQSAKPYWLRKDPSLGASAFSALPRTAAVPYLHKPSPSGLVLSPLQVLS